MTDKWTSQDMADQRGRTAVVTGANSGIGLIAARELARAGARVVLACRNTAKGADAAAGIRRSVAGAEVEVSELDLASLDSVARFARRLDEPLDLLVKA